MGGSSMLCCKILLVVALIDVTEQTCFQRDLKLTSFFCPTSNTNGVPVGGVCCKSNHETCTYSNAVAICKAEGWNILDSKYELLSREKRRVPNVSKGKSGSGGSTGIIPMFIEAVVNAVVPVIVEGVIAFFSWIGGLLTAKPNEHPVVPCFKLDPYISDFGTKSKTLQWTMPSAHDAEDGDISSKVQPRLANKTYNEGRTTETFTVRDSKGASNKEPCNIHVDITVPRCSRTLSTGNGTFKTTSDDIYHGVQITYSCNTGYELFGQRKLTCQSNEKYDSTIPKCIPVRCPNSNELKPKFGKPMCDHSTLEYKTICKTNCSEQDGYGLKDDVGYAQCKSDKTWSRPLPSCQDIKQPEIDYCPAKIEKFAPALETFMTVSWILPNASDNSGVKPVIKQMSGRDSGSVFDEGLTSISYIANDTEGNVSPPCSFDIIIKVRRCLPPSLKGKLLKYTPLPDYLLGSEVHVSCDGGFKIEGATTMTCTKEETDDGYRMLWDIGNNTYPYCKQMNCSELPTPANGAIACDKWLFGTMCQMQCNINYDIPLGPWTTGQYVCSMSSGEWRPTNVVPGCTEKRDPNNMVLPGEIFYYTGNCSDEKTLRLIKENFIKYMQDLQNTKFEGVCVDDDECSIENVEVRCGQIETNRKKRSSVTIPSISKTSVKFNINVKWQTDNYTDDQFKSRKQLLDTVSNKIKIEVDNGALNMQQLGLEVDTNSTLFGEPSIKCGKGQLPKNNGLSCVTCPLGYELNDTTSECDECPMNYFRDESLAECKQCPRGSFTRTEGAVFESDCKAMCPAGSFSSDGMEPCNKCSPNSYQQSSNSTSCTTCPFGATTYGAGATSINNCSGFDLKIDGSDGFISFGKIADNITAFSVAFWIKLERHENKTADFVLVDTNNQLIVNLSNGLHLTMNGESVNTSVNIENKKWVHLAITYDVVSTDVNIYTAGTKVYTNKISISHPVLNQNSSLLFQNANEGTKVVLSNVIFSPMSISDEGIRNLSSQCSIDPAISMVESFIDPWMWKLVNTEIIIPSTCDAFNDCLSSPCGENSECKNNPSGYVCTCLNGFTGQHCNIPPNYCAKSQCQNEATCTSSLTGYTCDCEEGYKGNYCQIKIVNGQWSYWSGWSACSVTCGGGFRQRRRYCDDPAPDPDGKTCAGDDVQNRTCSEDACPECPEFPSVYGVLHECNKTDEMITCTVSCRTGLAFIPQEPPLDVYECGRDTRYKWNSVPPSCTEFYNPKSIKTKTSVKYPNLSCSNKEEAKRQIIENSHSLKCLANNTCDADIQIEDCSTSEDTVKASIELKSTITNADLDFEGFLKTSIPNDAMKSFLNSLNDLSLSVHKLNTSEKFYHLNIGGISYGADFTSAQTQVGVDCEEGRVQSALFCADCPQGTYYLDNKCEPCEFGMYQDEIAQVKCKPCPERYTTDYRGAKLKTECDVYVEKKVVKKDKIPELNVEKKVVKTDKIPESSDNSIEVWIPIVASVLSCVVVIVVAIVIWFLVKKRYCISQKKKAYIYKQRS